MTIVQLVLLSIMLIAYSPTCVSISIDVVAIVVSAKVTWCGHLHPVSKSVLKRSMLEKRRNLNEREDYELN